MPARPLLPLLLKTSLLLAALCLLAAPRLAAQQPGTVKAQTKLGADLGGFTGDLDFGDAFGLSVTVLDDLDGDGVRDLAVGANGDDADDSDIHADIGAVWVIFMNADGTAKGQHRINAEEPALAGALEDRDWFGYSVEGLGDVDGDGTYDLLIGAGGDDDGGNGRGAVYRAGLAPDGSVTDVQKISATAGGFSGHLANQDAFGFSAARLGDLDGDGLQEFAVGHVFNDDGGFDAGGLYTLGLGEDGLVQRDTEIAHGKGGFQGRLDALDELGRSLAAIGDLDGDGVCDLAAGAFGDSDGAPNAGSVWILFMAPDGTVRDEQKISATQGGFDGWLPAQSRFGSAVAPVGDLDADGVIDLAVGASRGPLFALGPSRVFVLFMNRDGTVRDELEIGTGLGGFSGTLADGDRFGTSLHDLGDLDGDGVHDLAVGANGDDEGGQERGAVYVLFLNGRPTAQWSLTWSVAKPGTLAPATLSGEGLAQSGTPASVHLAGALPRSQAHIVAGATTLAVPFKGGTLFPAPDLLLTGLPIDDAGALDIPFTWPPGVPLGAPIHLQAWIVDGGASEGLSASNGLTVIAD